MTKRTAPDNLGQLSESIDWIDAPLTGGARIAAYAVVFASLALIVIGGAISIALGLNS